MGVYTVSGAELVTLMRELVRADMQWVYYQARYDSDPVNRHINRDQWVTAAGKVVAYLHCISTITGIKDDDLSAAMRTVVSIDQDENKLTTYAYQIAEALEIKLDD